MLKFYRSVLMAGVVALGLAACGDDVTVAPPGSSSGGVTSVTVAPTSASVTVGSSILLTASVIADSGKTGVTWVSSDPTIASVDANGRVTGVKQGSVTIVATSQANTAISGAAAVSVVAALTGINSFSVTPTSVTLAVGQSATAIANIQRDSGVAAPTVTWTSLTPAVATVDQTGKITAVTSGTAVVTAAITVGGVTETQAIAVTVSPTTPASISIQAINAGANDSGAGLPVTLANVHGQIDVVLNFNPGTQRIDSVVVSLRQGTTYKRAAKQQFNASIPSAGPLTLSVNTASYAKNPTTGNAVVDFQNGQTTLLAQVFPTGQGSSSAVNCSNSPNDPSCTAPTDMVLNNADGFAADNIKPVRNATDSAGNSHAFGSTFWGGPGVTGADSAVLYPLIYDSAGNGRNVTTVTWGIGSNIQSCDVNFAFTSGGWNGRNVFASGVAGDTDCTGHQNILGHRDDIVVLAAHDNLGNPFPTKLLSNLVVFGSTPDSLRVDWAGPSNVQRPTGEGWEDQHWVNATWTFNHDGTEIDDAGVGPSDTSWHAYVGPGYTTEVKSGADLNETNTNTTDGYSLQATGADRLGNISTSAIGTTFGVDKTAPSLRYSATTSPSSYASIYTGGGTAAVQDSTTYNAFQGLYGANVLTAGAQDLFVGTAAGNNDSVRVEAIDSRAGLYRGIEMVQRFAQGGATGATSTITSVNFTIDQAATTTTGFLPATIDGWLPLHAVGVTGGSTAPGYYTSTAYVVDKAGNASGCPDTRASDGANGAACTAAAPAAGNAFARRTLALDPGQPQVTGVSPNNNYAGNMPVVFTLGSQNDLEVIDAKLRLQYPNLTEGDNAGTIPAAGGLVWTYALSNSLLASGYNAGPASGTGVNFGYFAPIGIRFDNSIINPSITPLTLDMFTDNVQETCTGTTGTATGPTTAADCGASAKFVGDPIPTDVGGIPLAIPTNVGVQVRDVFGSWIFNSTPSAVTGVSNEFVSPILSATVQAPATTFGVSYYDPGLGQSCPAGGAVQAAGSPTCVNGGINFRADNTLSTAGTKVFRATELLSETLPIFTRVDFFGLNAQNQWVFIARIVVPNPVSVSASCPASTPAATGVVGCDNGLERYWLYTFTGAPAGFSEFRAIGVDANGSGLASTVHN